ncbi:MAG: hypothetical protein AAGC56_05715 [Pseudomonadota bacterium]
MTSLDPLALAGAKAKGKRPFFLENPDVERLMTIVMAVAQELAVVRERLDTVERLLDEKGTISRADIEAFSPDKAAADERGAWMQEYLARVLRVLQQDREALQAGDQYSEEIAEELAKS